MKYHYIYFLILPILLIIALMLPLTINDYGTMGLSYRSAFEDETALIFLIPTLFATILLLIRNNITAIIGTSIYLLSFVLAVFMNYILHFASLTDYVGIGAVLILLVMLIGLILGLMQSVKMTKVRRHKRKQSHDLLDFDN